MLSRIKKNLLENGSIKQTVIKNTFWLFAGEIIGRLFKIFLVLYAARILGVENWGLFSYALAFVAVFISFTDVGLNTLVTKELTKDGESKFQYLSTAFYIKIILLVIAAILIFIFASMSKIHNELPLISLVFLFSLFDSAREFLMSINRAREKMELEASFKILTNFLVSILGIVFLLIYKNPLALAWGYTLGGLIGLITAYISLKDYRLKIFGSFSKDLVKDIFSSAWPLAIILASSVLLFNTDTLVIGHLKTITDVGLYSAAQKLTFIFHMIPGLFMIALFPTLTRSVNDKVRFKQVFNKAAKFLFLGALFITLVIIIFRNPIISIAYGNSYLGAVPSLKILILSTIPAFLNYVIVYSIIAFHEHRKIILSNISALILNVALNLALIPNHGITGAATATVLSLSFLTIMNYRELRKVLV